MAEGNEPYPPRERLPSKVMFSLSEAAQLNQGGQTSTHIAGV